ncbi:MAG: type II toxin-antitoxin system HicB family antitoxin [Alphaproteobacteria bacterium]|nr:MAG: type II toxin-antitoxin system HicB family antitoxin [Alphaproteobacteria bacterium]
MNAERALAYPVHLRKEGEAILVTCPDLPEVTTFGEDEADALLRAKGAIEEALAARIAHREDIPRPSSANGERTVPLDTNAALKVLLWRTMREKGLRKADLARRLGWHAPQIDRILDLNHHSRTDLLDQAFAALGRRVLVAIDDAA